MIGEVDRNTCWDVVFQITVHFFFLSPQKRREEEEWYGLVDGGGGRKLIFLRVSGVHIKWPRVVLSLSILPWLTQSSNWVLTVKQTQKRCSHHLFLLSVNCTFVTISSGDLWPAECSCKGGKRRVLQWLELLQSSLHCYRKPAHKWSQQRAGEGRGGARSQPKQAGLLWLAFSGWPGQRAPWTDKHWGVSLVDLYRVIHKN